MVVGTHFEGINRGRIAHEWADCYSLVLRLVSLLAVALDGCQLRLPELFIIGLPQLLRSFHRLLERVLRLLILQEHLLECPKFDDCFLSPLRLLVRRFQDLPNVIVVRLGQR